MKQSALALKLEGDPVSAETEEERAARVDRMRQQAARICNRLNGGVHTGMRLRMVFPSGYHRVDLLKMTGLVGQLLVADEKAMGQVNSVLASEKDRGHAHRIFVFSIDERGVGFGQSMKLMDGVAPFLESIELLSSPVLVA